MELTVAQLAERIGAELVGEGSARIIAVGAISSASEDEITFILERYSGRHIAQLRDSKAAAVIVAGRIDGLDKPQLVVRDTRAALIKALNLFAPQLKAPAAGIDPMAKVAPSAKIGKGVCVGPAAVIEDNVQIGENTVIAAGCKIGQNTIIGKNCRIDCNVVIYHNCTIGNSVIIQANTTIGSTGFGYYFIDGQHRLIPHNGTVVIEDFVEIGANCCVDRAKFDETRISAGTKIDNLVQIAHNVVIGKNCLMAGQAGIGGSSKLGDGVILGGMAGIIDNVNVGNGVMIGAGSVVFEHTVPASEQLFGSPAENKLQAIRSAAIVKRLPEMNEQLKELDKRVQKLETAEDDKKRG